MKNQKVFVLESGIALKKMGDRRAEIRLETGWQELERVPNPNNDENLRLQDWLVLASNPMFGGPIKFWQGLINAGKVTNRAPKVGLE